MFLTDQLIFKYRDRHRFSCLQRWMERSADGRRNRTLMRAIVAVDNSANKTVYTGLAITSRHLGKFALRRG